MLNLKEQEAQDELDELLQQSVAAAKPKTKASNDLGDLDDLLAESIAIRDEASATKANRERLKRGNLSRDEREEIEAKVRAWEAANVWTTVANVAVFEHINCACGFYTEAFSHIMHQQSHRVDPNLRRLIRSDEVIVALPKFVAKQISDVEICAECALEKGWNLDDAKEGLEWLAAPI